MDEIGAVTGVLAVIAGVVMSAGSIQGALTNKREELRVRIDRRRGLRRIVGMVDQSVVRKGGPRESIRRCRHGDTGRSDVTWVMSESCVRHRGVCAATLMIQAQFISAGKVHRDSRVNDERQ